MKRLSVLRQPKWLVSVMIVLLLAGLSYIQISNQRAAMMVKLGDSQQRQLLDYQRQAVVRHSEFEIQPRQSYFCAGRFYCVEQSVVQP